MLFMFHRVIFNLFIFASVSDIPISQCGPKPYYSLSSGVQICFHLISLSEVGLESSFVNFLNHNICIQGSRGPRDMPKQTRGGSRGGLGGGSGRGGVRGGGNRGGGRGVGHSMGPGGDGRGRGRSLSSRGVGGKNDDPSRRGGRGGFGGGRGSMNR